MMRHGTLSHAKGAQPDPDATLTIDRTELNEVILGAAKIEELADAGKAKVDGDAGALRDLVGLLDEFEFWFNIVTP